MNYLNQNFKIEGKIKPPPVLENDESVHIKPSNYKSYDDYYQTKFHFLLSFD